MQLQYILFKQLATSDWQLAEQLLKSENDYPKGL